MSLLHYIAAIAAQVAQPVPAEAEMLGIDAPDEFEVGYQAGNDSSLMMELIVPPETVETWSKLITLQLIYNASNSPGLNGFYSRWRISMRDACAGMIDSVQQGTVGADPR